MWIFVENVNVTQKKTLWMTSMANFPPNRTIHRPCIKYVRCELNTIVSNGNFYGGLFFIRVLFILYSTSTDVRVNLVWESNRNNVTEVIYSIHRPIDIERHKLFMDWMDAPYNTIRMSHWQHSLTHIQTQRKFNIFFSPVIFLQTHHRTDSILFGKFN